MKVGTVTWLQVTLEKGVVIRCPRAPTFLSTAERPNRARAPATRQQGITTRFAVRGCLASIPIWNRSQQTLGGRRCLRL